MFGMDARIALIVASVLAATGGVTVMSRLDSSKSDGTERGVSILRDALEAHYRTIGISTISADIATLFSNGLVADSNLQTDPWTNAWHYNRTSSSETIEGIPVTIHMAVIHSSGKDGIDDSVTISNKTQYSAWAPAGDDIGIKFSTISVEKERVLEFREQAKLVVDKITAHESGRYLVANTTCTATPADASCSDSGKSYTQYNYYPKSSLDSTSAVYYDPDVSSEQQTYTAGNLADMQQLLTDIGLPTSMATDPWGRVMYFDSNITSREIPPFTASICYSSGGSCF